jgi:hypothetical protein
LQFLLTWSLHSLFCNSKLFVISNFHHNPKHQSSSQINMWISTLPQVSIPRSTVFAGQSILPTGATTVTGPGCTREPPRRIASKLHLPVQKLEIWEPILGDEIVEKNTWRQLFNCSSLISRATALCSHSQRISMQTPTVPTEPFDWWLNNVEAYVTTRFSIELYFQVNFSPTPSCLYLYYLL